MLFVELRFFVFFAVVFAVAWALRSNRGRKHFLLLASYFFYAAWDWRFLSLIFVSTAVDFVAGRMLARPEPPGGRRVWLWFSVGGNLTLLGFFKYYNFFVESGTELFDLIGLPFPARTLEIVLPVGISFFTFQSMSYTFDVYRRRLDPVSSFLDFGLFVAFFPQLVAGPIVRAATFLPQLTGRPRWADVEVRRNLTLFLVGFVKKACVADQLARAVDPVFANPAAYAAASKWIAVMLYHVQIYCDFSGYTDMAIATAGLLGYQLTRNFDFPYFAKSMREFWQRWHISLLSWFRDYVYLPMALRSRRHSWAMLCVVILMLLSGLWHGAAWNFVVWGLFHGLLLVAERTRFGAWLDARTDLLRFAYVQLAIFVNWVLFRSADVKSAFAYLRDLFGGFSPSVGVEAASVAAPWLLAVAGFWLVHFANHRTRPLERVESVPPLLFGAAYGAVWAAALPWVATGHQPFIYFQF